MAALTLNVLLDEPVPFGEFASELNDLAVGLTQQLAQIAVALLKNLLLRSQQRNLVVPLLQLTLQPLDLSRSTNTVLFHLLRQICIAAGHLAQLPSHLPPLFFALLHVYLCLCDPVAKE